MSPGQTTDVVFGDPGSGMSEIIACGGEITITLSMIGGSGEQVGVREYHWQCTECRPVASSVDDDTAAAAVSDPSETEDV